MRHPRIDHGWLRINDQPIRHYWVQHKVGDIYRSLCGRLAAPYTIEIAGHRDACSMCTSIRHHETESDDVDPAI